MTGGDADAFGDASPKLRWSNNFGMTSVTENQALQFVVDHDLQ